MATLGETIKAKRKKLKMSVLSVAFNAGIGKDYLYKLEAGAYKTPSFELVDKLAAILGLDVRVLRNQILSTYKERMKRNENRGV